MARSKLKCRIRWYNARTGRRVKASTVRKRLYGGQTSWWAARKVICRRGEEMIAARGAYYIGRKV